MGVLSINIFITAAVSMGILAPFQGSNGLSHHHHHQLFRHPPSFHSFKEITAAVPFTSQNYDLEILTPMSQMSQRKHVPVFLVPESSFHIFPTFPSSLSHLPAIEIPLAEPMMLRGPRCEVVAPTGFTVFSHGGFQPFYTVALLAPVPAGTHVSSDTPVVINVLYAVPKLPHQLPSYQNVVTKIPVSSTTTTTEKSTGIVVPAYPESLVPSNDDTVSISLGNGGINNEPRPLIDNAKESPYLQELRLESLERQLEEIQNQIRKIKRLRN